MRISVTVLFLVFSVLDLPSFTVAPTASEAGSDVQVDNSKTAWWNWGRERFSRSFSSGTTTKFFRRKRTSSSKRLRRTVSKANEWLELEQNHGDLRTQVQQIETKLIKYFAQESVDGSLLLADIADERQIFRYQSKLAMSNPAPDMPDQFPMHLTQEEKDEERNVQNFGKHCIRRCLHIYGYVFAPLQEGCSAEFTMSDEVVTKDKGVIIPVTDGIVEYLGEVGPAPKPKGRKGSNTPSPSRTSSNSPPNELRLVRQNSFQNVVCHCKTREDLGALFLDNGIKMNGFKSSKTKSSHAALKKLRNIFQTKKNVINLLGHREAMGLIYVQMSKALGPERQINVTHAESRTTVMEAMGVEIHGLREPLEIMGHKVPFSKKYRGNYWWDVQI